MTLKLNIQTLAGNLVGLSMAIALTGCGGGGASSEPAAPSANAAMFKDLISYCGASQPTAEDASRDGWVSEFPSFNNGSTYQSSSIVSASGSKSAWEDPIVMKVGVRDYRGVTGSFVPSGYGKPEWLMGASIPTVLDAQSVACVTQVARVKHPVDPLAGIPNVPHPDLSPTLNWQSFWSRMVPVEQLSGYHVDGFEFVSNFSPSDGQVYFIVDKSRFQSPQNLSICYLAPTATQWDCAQPTIADQGANWQIYKRGVKQGVYILNSTTLQ